MEIKVSRIKETRTFNGLKSYDEIDITNQVVMPIIDVERLDATLDTSSLTLINTEEHAIEPFTRMIIRIKNADNTTDNIYRLVERDDVTLYKYGANPKYQHDIQLVEITKWLERFEVDNTTITNFLAFLYTDESVINALGIKTTTNYTKVEKHEFYDQVYTQDVAYVYNTNVVDKTPDIEFYNTYIQGARLKTEKEYQCKINYRYWHTIIPPLIVYHTDETAVATLTSYTIKKPDGTTASLIDTPFYELTQVGKYTIKQVYVKENLAGGDANNQYGGRTKYTFELTWELNVIEEPDVEKLPTKYTLSQVIDIILNKVGNEATVIRENIDEPMFSLDPAVRAKFDTIIAPEFTFTQDTLFGVLSKVGEIAHAIPRLLPNPVPDGETTDDFSDWNIITYDFLGGDEEASEGEITAKGSYYDGNDYTTNYVSNVQNSFQTSDADYITLTEPYDGGWISPRTEASDFIISNDEAVIKTSRPIQRIVSLECLWFESENSSIVLDLSKHIKEITDYNLLDDYATTNGIGSKQNYLYYTRGSNIIGGLTYQAPAWLSILTAWQNRSIENIINAVYGSDVGDITIKNLKFRIKYVPFYDLKIKQYKPYINDHSGNNELFYNQVNTQTVEIDGLGEAMKGALLRVSNEEPNITEYFTNHNECVKSGQLLDDTYYVYQVNKEINNNRVKATVQFSKDFNKWNEYVAIKKNYREWEISERESHETNPVYSNFCMITDKPEFYVLIGIYETEEPITDTQLNALLPIPIETSPAWQSADQFMVINKVGDTYTKCKTYNDHYTRRWSREQIYLEKGLLIINDKYLGTDEASLYYQGLTKDKGVLNAKFFTQLVTRMSNDLTNDLYKISWVVGTTYTNEWQGGADYKQVKKSFMLPCACFSVGNSVVFDFGAKDNYSIGTHATDQASTYALEEYVDYGDKFGKVDSLELRYGHDDVISNAYNTETVANENSKTFYSIDESKVPYPNVLIDYQQTSGYEIGLQKTYSVFWSRYYYNATGYQPTANATPVPLYLYVALPDYYLEKNTLYVSAYAMIDGNLTRVSSQTITKDESERYFYFNIGVNSYRVWQFVPGALYIKVNSGSDQLMSINGVILRQENENYAGDSTITLDSINYTITNDTSHHELKLNDGTNNYYSYKNTSGMFRINKDSRQSLQFTNQLHFITDNSNIWIGSALAKTMPFVGETEKGIYKMVGFTKRPSKFEIVPNPDDYEELTGSWTKWYSNKTYTMKLYGLLAQNDYKGVGILDNKNRLVLYYNKEIETGEYTPTLYIRLRRKL